MAINKKLIHFLKKQKFSEELAKGNILNTSIVFILDSKEIYTHGQYYGDLSECLTKYPHEFTKEEKDLMLENLGYYAVEWDGVSETIELSDEEYRKIISATNVMLVIFGELYLLPISKGPGVYGYTLGDYEAFGYYTLDANTNPLSITGVVFYIPSKTSDLENDSNFISSDNLKTINGESILGSGDITISGGGNSEANVAAVDTGSSVDDVETGTITGIEIKTINGISILGSGNLNVGYKTLTTSTSSSMSLSPNVYYRNTSTSLSSLTITLASATDSTILNEYFVEFTTRSSGTTVSLPSSIKWANGETPSFEASTTYQISIINNLGIVTKFK